MPAGCAAATGAPVRVPCASGARGPDGNLTFDTVTGPLSLGTDSVDGLLYPDVVNPNRIRVIINHAGPTRGPTYDRATGMPSEPEALTLPATIDHTAEASTYVIVRGPGHDGPVYVEAVNADGVEFRFTS